MGKYFNILIVEEDDSDFCLLKQNLNSISNFPIRLAHEKTLRQAIDLNKRHPFDIILLDQDLIDSIDTNTLKTQLENFPELPVIVLTGHDDEKDIYQIIDSGAQDYLLKGKYTPDHLFRKIAFAINRQRDKILAQKQSQLSIDLSNANKLHQAFNAILKFGLSLNEFEVGGIYHLNPETNSFHLSCHSGLSKEFFNEVKIIDNTSSLSKMMMAGNSIFQSIQEGPSEDFETMLNEGLRSLALLPLKDRGKIIGCLNLGSKRYRQISKKLINTLEVTLAKAGNVIHRIRIDEQLIESQRNYKDLVEKTEIAICVDNDQGEITYANKAFFNVFGYNESELSLLRHSLLLHPEDLKMVSKNHNNRINGEDVVNRYEARGIHKDGSIIHLEFILSDIIEKDGIILGSRTYILNITDRKRNEEALAYSESFNRRLMENSPIGLLHINAKGVVSYDNKALRDIIGLKPGMDSPIIGKNFEELKSITESGLHNLFFKIKNGEPVQAETIKFKAYNGHNLILSVYATTLINKQNRFDGAILMMNDVTEKQKSDQALRISEEKYRTLFEKSTDPILILSKNNFIDCNQAALDLLKYSNQDRLYNVHPSDISPEYQPDGRTSIEKADQMLSLALKNGFHRFDWLHKDSSDKEFWVDVSLTLIPSENEPLIYTVWRNINDKKLAEKALKENEEKYRIIFENSPVGIVITDLEGNILVFNDQLVEMSAYSKQEFETLTVFDLYQNSADRQMVIESIKEKGHIQNTEINFVKKDGERFVANMSSSQYMLGQTPALLTVIFDITDRKKSQTTQEIIHNISSAVPTTDSINQLYEVIQQELSKIVEAKNFTIGFYKKDTDEIYFPYMHDEKHQLKYAPAAYTISSIVFSKNKSILLNTEQLTRLRKEGKIINYGGEAKSWLGVPFGSNNNTEGILIVQDYEKDNAFSMEDQRLLEIIANQVAISISRKRNEDQIRKLSRSVEQSPASIVITNLDGQIEYVNKKFTEVTGYSFDEVKGENPNILQSRKTPQDTYKQMWNDLTSGKEWRGTFCNQRKSGEIYYEEAYITPLNDATGIPTHYLAVKEDISERIRTENELIEAKNRAEESHRIKSAFLANMSHELRTPLNAVIGFSELIPESEEDEVFEYAKLINDSGHHLLSIIEDIFDISVLESGDVEVTQEEIILKNLFEDIGQLAKKEIKQQFKGHIEFKIEPNIDPELKFHCDPNKIRKVFAHLIKNAVKFTEQGSIEVGYEQTSTHLRFFVSDTGIGIPTNKQQVIFEAFRQVDETHTREYGGTGVGLAISKKMMELMGGEIFVKSEPKKGTTFFFTIPYENIKATTMQALQKQYPNLEGKTILIAEDEETNFLYLEALLQRTKAKVIWAENGRFAVDLFEENPVDVILMDLKMPDMNGYDAAKIIREKSSETVIIAQTAFALPGDKQKALDIGFNDYITKPISKQELMKVLTKYNN